MQVPLGNNDYLLSFWEILLKSNFHLSSYSENLTSLVLFGVPLYLDGWHIPHLQLCDIPGLLTNQEVLGSGKKARKMSMLLINV